MLSSLRDQWMLWDKDSRGNPDRTFLMVSARAFMNEIVVCLHWMNGEIWPRAVPVLVL